MFNLVSTDTSKVDRYKILKPYSTTQETDNLIINILTINQEQGQNNQIDTAFRNWETLQHRKVCNQIIISWSSKNWAKLFAKSIKYIDSSNLTVGYRWLHQTNEVEYWVICKEKDYEILNRISELQIDYETILPFTVDIVFIGEKQFIGKDMITFEEVI